MHRVAALMVAVAVLVAVAATVSPASAGDAPSGGGNCSGPDCVAFVATPGGPAVKGSTPFKGSGSTSPIVCKYVQQTGDGFSDADPSTLKNGDVVYVACMDPGTGQQIGQLQMVVWPPAQPVPQPSAADLARVAIGRLSVPVPAVRVWPPAGTPGLVNLPVILRVDNWAPLSALASAGGLTATVTAAPVRVVWNMDEDLTTCHDGGSVWFDGAAPSDMSCTYTYRHSSGGQPNQTFSCFATIVWHVRWDATNGQGGDLGEVERTTGFGVQIQESQAVIGVPPSSGQGG